MTQTANQFPTWADELGDFLELPASASEYELEVEWEHAKPRPFDLKRCIKTYKNALRTKKEPYPQYKLWTITQEWVGAFDKITDEEAIFWLVALTDPDAEMDELESSKTLDRIEQINTSVKPPIDEIANSLGETLYGKFGGTPPYYYYDANRWGPLALLMRQLYGLPASMEAILDKVRIEDSASFFEAFGPAGDDRDACVAMVDEKVDPAIFDGSNYSILYYAAPALLPLAPSQKLIRKVYDTFIARGTRWWNANIPKLVLFLEDEEILEYSKKLSFKFTPPMMRHLIARFGIERAEDMLKFATNRTHKSQAKELIPLFYMVHARAMVPRMLELTQRETSMDEATYWLQNEGANAIDGLIELVGRQGKKRRWAIEQLRVIHDRGHGELIESLLESHKATAKKLVRQEVIEFEEEVIEEAAVDELPAVLKKIASDYAIDASDRELFKLDQAPPLILAESGEALPVEVTEAILAMCKIAHPLAKKKKQPAANKTLVKELMKLRPLFEPDPAGLWVWHLFERWWARGTEEDDSWFIWMLGYLGQSPQATLLLKRIKGHNEWFGRGKKGRNAVKAVQSLRHIGTRQAYTTLYQIAEEAALGVLVKAAQQEVKALKRAKGWSDHQFEDRIVPDAGLDENGTYIFDYGPRKFKLYFRGAFDFEFVDEEGKHFTRIPAVRKTDDVDKVTRAKEDYKVIREQIVNLVGRQTTRLENALIEGRVWPKEDWTRYILQHPLMMHFARKLIWCTCDEEGVGEVFFLPSEDQSCVGTDFEPVEMKESHVRLCHPAELDEEAKLEWSEFLTDFEVVQPFDQLNRPTYRYGDEEAKIRKRVASIFEGRWSWYVQDTVKRKLGTTWEVKTINYNPAMVMRDLYGVRIVMMLDNQGWELEDAEEGTPSYKKGLFFLQAHKLDPKKYRIKDKDVPPAVFSEAIWALRQLATEWGKL